jgi:spermidine synthase
VKPFERLGEAHTPDGTRLEFFRHDGSYLIRADGVELMSSRRHVSEDRLAEVACAGLRDHPRARVLIGGLGLGFTLRAAMAALGPDAEIVVAELMAEVIAWNANPEYDLSAKAMADPRVRIVHDDVYKVLAENAQGFDAIMLDTDNGPEGMIMSENDRLYAARGVQLTIAALRPPGVIAYWSVGEDHKFVDILRRAKLRVETLREFAHGKRGATHLIFVARPQRAD